MQTVLEIIGKTAGFFARRGIEHPRLNAELLVGHGLGLKRMQLYLQFERPLTEAELDRIRPLVKRRADREPLQYVLGTEEFAGVTVNVDRRALIPRPETERLVEILTERFAADAPARVLDLGTGSGAIALALARAWPAATVTGVDASADALALANENLAASGAGDRVRFLSSNWFSALPAGETFALIVANPPYLSDAEVAEAAPEVRDFEPRQALSAGADAAAALEAIIASAGPWLAPGGLLALETGLGQHARLEATARGAGFGAVESRPDLTGRPRFLLLAR